MILTHTLRMRWSRLLMLGLAALIVGVSPLAAEATQRAATEKKSVKKVTDRQAKAGKPAAQKTSAQKRQRQARKPANAVRPGNARSVVFTRPSHGERAGLRGTDDPLELGSSVALVVDQDTHEVLFSKNDGAVLPIASLTKLMTAIIVSEARLPMDESITITQEDVDTEKGSRSRLRVGTVLSRGELMHLALMSSENRAAHALGRTHPGGMDAFVRLMNDKARALGMNDSRFVEPTGLSSRNQSSAKDLAVLTHQAYQDPLLREYSTSPGAQVAVGSRVLQFNNTNRLVLNPNWEIGLQKTGYISEAGRCLVMQARVAGRKLIMVFLDSAGKYTRLGDAERVRNWLESQATRERMPGVQTLIRGATS